MDWTRIVEMAVMVYGVLALIVKTFPTIPAKFPWLVTLMKWLGNIANRQTDDDAVRAAQK